ncbi:MAG: isoprenoid biosynthesis protein ElbB [Bacteroidetes bacterium GWF2_43_63]|nr:MAG: isoprenoid biosynthesis protein ElbB [Bacteroidetes bacterium GWE2_42_42]OFY52773.1 MAG: isoprenoid biosynthesis protein ElbB [Bacteroidetes bacterium GWF2_43_63]HBG70024.1 isoprenoid biosynthesis protein ElbB [Bacteroidales bacterium]HCB62371.1 isoprenoid biosynthesis protein ElbB [Bacteroidales bacterium]HCY22442.1 isoprenoid biosynthesis protein ElbB [Bacteroidales bacterium]
MKKIAIVLSGCGVFDGTEIHEATMSMLAVDQQGAQYELFAPDINQAHVINHLTGKPGEEIRNVLVESARIARGKIRNLKDFNPAEFDALLFPGGSGAVRNLSDYAFKGVEMSVNSDVEKAIKSMHAAGKPIGALCIAPVLLAKVIGGCNVTIGNDKDTASHIEKMSAHHSSTNATGIVIDEKNKLVTTPCYMLGTRISEIYEGTGKVVTALLKMM